MATHLPSLSERTWFRVAVVACLLVATVLLRTVPAWDTVVREDGIHLLGVDPLFHVRHIAATAETFPHLERMDAQSHHPQVVRSDAVGLMQWTLGGLTWLLGGGRETADWVAAWSGPLWAVGIALAFLGVCVRLWGWNAALWLSLLLLVQPGRTFDRTVFGFCDHHGLEVILNLAVLFGFLQAVRFESLGRHRLAAAALALPCILFVFTWIGAPLLLGLHFAALGLGLLLVLIGGNPVAMHARVAGRGALWSLGGLLLVALIWPDLVIEPSHFRQCGLFLLASAGAFFLLARIDARLNGAGARRLAGGGLLIGLMAAAFTLHQLSGYIRAQVAYAFERKLFLVLEHQALTPAVLWFSLGLLAYLALGGLVTTLARLHKVRPELPPVIMLASLVLLLWWRTADYDYLAVPMALLLASALLVPAFNLALRFTARFPRIPAALPGPALATTALAILVLTLYPIGSVGGAVRPSRYYPNFLKFTDAWHATAAWLAEVPREPAIGGVWTPWPFGNGIAAYSGWPVNQSRYPQPEIFRPLFTPNETEARQLPIHDRPFSEATRFIVLNASIASSELPAELMNLGIPHESVLDPAEVRFPDGTVERLPRFNRRYADTLLGRGYVLNGSGLRHFRLVHDSTQMAYLRFERQASGVFLVKWSPLPEESEARSLIESRARDATSPWVEEGKLTYGARVLPEVRVFEQVKGVRARLADPNIEELTARLELTSAKTGQTFPYEQQAERGPDGAFYLNLPYSNNPPEWADVRPTGPYRLEVLHKNGNRMRAAFEVDETAVREGRMLRMEGQLRTGGGDG